MSWQNHNLTFWTGQVQNLVQEGYDDSIVLVNALGIEQSIKIASIPDVNRGLSAWTIGWASTGLIADLIVCQVVHCSLVRGSPLHPEELGIDWDTDMYNGNTETVGRRLVRNSLGPYISIDLRFVQPPSSLIRLFTVFDESFSSLPRLDVLDEICTVDAVLIAWQSNEFVFYGGNPLCPFGPAKEYIQQSFGYYDDCGSQDQHTIDFASRSVAFAVSAISLEPNDIPLTCRASTSSYSSCSNFLMKIATGMKVSLQRDQVHEATQDVEALNLTMIQMATNTPDNTDMILTQDMIAAGDPWSIFGWVTIWEWVDGQREVFVFEESYLARMVTYNYLQIN
ncbi:hypothetical protein LEN26_011919 [Aphanomyces euteiches]|nr:hypothetical protein LEN26_011919 [Aphanomyces euteiches]